MNYIHGIGFFVFSDKGYDLKYKHDVELLFIFQCDVVVFLTDTLSQV